MDETNADKSSFNDTLKDDAELNADTEVNVDPDAQLNSPDVNDGEAEESEMGGDSLLVTATNPFACQNHNETHYDEGNFEHGGGNPFGDVHSFTHHDEDTLNGTMRSGSTFRGKEFWNEQNEIPFARMTHADLGLALGNKIEVEEHETNAVISNMKAEMGIPTSTVLCVRDEDYEKADQLREEQRRNKLTIGNSKELPQEEHAMLRDDSMPEADKIESDNPEDHPRGETPKQEGGVPQKIDFNRRATMDNIRNRLAMLQNQYLSGPETNPEGAKATNPESVTNLSLPNLKAAPSPSREGGNGLQNPTEDEALITDVVRSAATSNHGTPATSLSEATTKSDSIADRVPTCDQAPTFGDGDFGVLMASDAASSKQNPVPFDPQVGGAAVVSQPNYLADGGAVRICDQGARPNHPANDGGNTDSTQARASETPSFNGSNAGTFSIRRSNSGTRLVGAMGDKLKRAVSVSKLTNLFKRGGSKGSLHKPGSPDKRSESSNKGSPQKGARRTGFFGRRSPERTLSFPKACEVVQDGGAEDVAPETAESQVRASGVNPWFKKSSDRDGDYQGSQNGSLANQVPPNPPLQKPNNTSPQDEPSSSSSSSSSPAEDFSGTGDGVSLQLLPPQDDTVSEIVSLSHLHGFLSRSTVGKKKKKQSKEEDGEDIIRTTKKKKKKRDKHDSSAFTFSVKDVNRALEIQREGRKHGALSKLQLLGLAKGMNKKIAGDRDSDSSASHIGSANTNGIIGMKRTNSGSNDNTVSIDNTISVNNGISGQRPKDVGASTDVYPPKEPFDIFSDSRTFDCSVGKKMISASRILSPSKEGFKALRHRELRESPKKDNRENAQKPAGYKTLQDVRQANLDPNRFSPEKMDRFVYKNYGSRVSSVSPPKHLNTALHAKGPAVPAGLASTSSPPKPSVAYEQSDQLFEPTDNSLEFFQTVGQANPLQHPEEFFRTLEFFNICSGKIAALLATHSLPPLWKDSMVVGETGAAFYMHEYATESQWKHPLWDEIDSLLRILADNKLLGERLMEEELKERAEKEKFSVSIKNSSSSEREKKFNPGQILGLFKGKLNQFLQLAHARSKQELELWSGPYEGVDGEYYYNASTEKSQWIDPVEEAEYTLKFCTALIHELCKEREQELRSTSLRMTRTSVFDRKLQVPHQQSGYSSEEETYNESADFDHNELYRQNNRLPQIGAHSQSHGIMLSTNQHPNYQSTRYRDKRRKAPIISPQRLSSVLPRPVIDNSLDERRDSFGGKDHFIDSLGGMNWRRISKNDISTEVPSDSQNNSQSNTYTDGYPSSTETVGVSNNRSSTTELSENTRNVVTNEEPRPIEPGNIFVRPHVGEMRPTGSTMERVEKLDSPYKALSPYKPHNGPHKRPKPLSPYRINSVAASSGGNDVYPPKYNVYPPNSKMQSATSASSTLISTTSGSASLSASQMASSVEISMERSVTQANRSAIDHRPAADPAKSIYQKRMEIQESLARLKERPTSGYLRSLRAAKLANEEVKPPPSVPIGRPLSGHHSSRKPPPTPPAAILTGKILSPKKPESFENYKTFKLGNAVSIGMKNAAGGSQNAAGGYGVRNASSYLLPLGMGSAQSGGGFVQSAMASSLGMQNGSVPGVSTSSGVDKDAMTSSTLTSGLSYAKPLRPVSPKSAIESHTLESLSSVKIGNINHASGVNINEGNMNTISNLLNYTGVNSDSGSSHSGSSSGMAATEDKVDGKLNGKHDAKIGGRTESKTTVGKTEGKENEPFHFGNLKFGKDHGKKKAISSDATVTVKPPKPRKPGPPAPPASNPTTLPVARPKKTLDWSFVGQTEVGENG